MSHAIYSFMNIKESIEKMRVELRIKADDARVVAYHMKSVTEKEKDKAKGTLLAFIVSLDLLRDLEERIENEK